MRLIASVASILLQQVNFGVDFVGGTNMELTTVGPPPLSQIRAELAAIGANDAQVQGVGANGASIQFGTVGSTAITYAGTVSGSSMSGNYQVGGSAGGPWSASQA